MNSSKSKPHYCKAELNLILCTIVTYVPVQLLAGKLMVADDERGRLISLARAELYRDVAEVEGIVGAETGSAL
jgi:hypothetical protein